MAFRAQDSIKCKKLYGRVSGGRSDRAGLYRVLGLRRQRYGGTGQWLGGYAGVGLSGRGNFQYAGAGGAGERSRPRGKGNVWDVTGALTLCGRYEKIITII